MNNDSSQIMKSAVAFFIFSLDNGGAERVTSILANTMSSRNIRVTLFTMKAMSESSYVVDPAISIVNLSKHTGQGSLETGLLFNIRRIILLRRLLRQYDCDVLITMMTSANIVGILSTMFSSVKCISSERIHPKYGTTGRLWHVLRKYVYGKSHCVVMQTESGARWIRENTGCRNVQVIPNPLEIPLRSSSPLVAVPANSSKIMLGVGRLSDQKQFHHLILAFAKLSAQFDGWMLAIIGSGQDEVHLRRQIDDLGLGDRVMLVGRVGNIGDWYERADLFVMTSAFEGYPNALIEAMGYGLPVISYDCPSGPADVIEHYHNGMLVHLDNQEQLLDTIKDVLSDSALANRLGKNASQIAHSLNVEIILDRWLSTFR